MAGRRTSDSVLEDVHPIQCWKTYVSVSAGRRNLLPRCGTGAQARGAAAQKGAEPDPGDARQRPRPRPRPPAARGRTGLRDPEPPHRPPGFLLHSSSVSTSSLCLTSLCFKQAAEVVVLLTVALYVCTPVITCPTLLRSRRKPVFLIKLFSFVPAESCFLCTSRGGAVGAILKVEIHVNMSRAATIREASLNNSSSAELHSVHLVFGARPVLPLAGPPY